MAVILKCKMCGGDLAPAPGESVTECEFCGTKQTVPNQDSEKKLTLFSRANRLRFGCEFDKAAGIYESIIAEFPEEAEAYWGLVLCKYGIEYVDDPATGKKIPTCHRSSFDSVMDDPNLEQALENADAMARRLYRDEAKAIEELRKNIIEVSGREEPYDIFICYKETAPDGNRTVDSVIAQDVYDALTEKGYRVFFSRVTLEDKLGQEYEPYIFAALNSAKLMLAFGTDYEYYNAVWVKNEWSRFLKLMAQDKGKYLIPCYKNLDPYDMPKEFAKLQAQDMGKVGAMQDLLRGIEKILGVKKTEAAPQPAASAASGGMNAASLLERGMLFLEDGEFDEAAGYFNRVLDIDPRSAEAYLGLWMAEVKAKTEADAKTRFVTDFDKKYSNSRSWKRAKQFATALFAEKLNRWESERAAEEKLFLERKALIRKLTETLSSIQKRQAAAQEAERQRRIAAQESERKYNDAVKVMTSAHTKAAFKDAAEKFRTIPGFKDANALAEECLEKAEISRKDAIYDSARQEMIMDKIPCYESAVASFRTISGWRDAEKQIALCQKRIGEIKAKEEADRLKKQRQEEADRLKKQRQEEEKRIADEIAAKKRKKVIAIAVPIVCVCIAFVILLTQVIIPRQKYNKAMSMIGAGEYETALALLDGLEYKDSETQRINAAYQYYKPALDSAVVGDTIIFGKYEQDNITLNGKENIEWLVLAKKDNRLLVISQYALDCQPYNTEDVNVTWENCTLRTWLNENFFNAAFSDGEKGMIPTVTVSADKNPDYNTNPGNATEDKVFLLSITEANRYFKTDEERMCVPTAYAKAHGAYTSSDFIKGGAATGWWWLRSPGKVDYHVLGGGRMNLAANVDRDGGVISYGYDVSRDSGCVRPAMWIDLSE